MTLRLTRLDAAFPISNQDGTPTLQFLRLYNKSAESLEEAFNGLAQAVLDIQTAQATATAGVRELARIDSYPDPTNVLSGTDEAVGASITIAAHTRVYPVQGTIDVADVVIPAPATITTVEGGGGIANAVQYSVYYDDTTLADTTPDYKAVPTATQHADAQPGAAAGRHFVGVITTPADGAGGTSGTGGGPPGGGGGTVLP